MGDWIDRPCPTCGRWSMRVGHGHVCPPRWECSRDGEWVSRTTFYGDEPEEVAEAFAEWCEDQDAAYPDEHEVFVRRVGDETWTKVVVSVECVRSFSGMVVETPAAAGEEGR